METPVGIDGLPEALGFAETAQLRELRHQLTEAMVANADTVRTLAAEYHALAEALVEQHTGSEFTRAQIGLMVRMALVRRDAGRVEHYREDLADALTYAENMGFADIVPVLEETLATPTDSERSPEAVEPTSEQLAEVCGEVLSAEDCEELADMPMDEALGYAFSLLIENGVEDPEGFLRIKGILEQ